MPEAPQWEGGPPVTPEDYMRYTEYIRQMIEYWQEDKPQQQQQRQGRGPGMDVGSLIGGTTAGSAAGGSSAASGSTAGTASSASSSGIAGFWPAAVIAAAIAGQYYLSTKNPRREVEGEKTGTAFSGDFATEPWYAYLNAQLGNPPTGGERYDAAMRKGRRTGNYGDAFRRAPAAVDYWSDPIRATGRSLIQGFLGNKAATVADPIGTMLLKL